jgi:hypothetical protein
MYLLSARRTLLGMRIRNSDVVAGLADVDEIMLEDDVHGARYGAHRQPLHLFLYLDLLVIRAVDRRASCDNDTATSP